MVLLLPCQPEVDLKPLFSPGDFVDPAAPVFNLLLVALYCRGARPMPAVWFKPTPPLTPPSAGIMIWSSYDC
eukprot:734487-Rhodomonas_salina.1